MKKISLAVLASLSLAACGNGDVRDTLGMKIDAPDEFAVERKPRLEIPPSFQLRPPSAGEAPLNAVQTRDIARDKIIGSSTVVTTGTPGEASFLNKAGVSAANPEIRGVLTKEYPATAELTTLESIRSISDDNIGQVLVDPEKEKERIEANKQENKPITEGETPTKSINDGKTVIDKIFN